MKQLTYIPCGRYYKWIKQTTLISLNNLSNQRKRRHGECVLNRALQKYTDKETKPAGYQQQSLIVHNNRRQSELDCMDSPSFNCPHFQIYLLNIFVTLKSVIKLLAAMFSRLFFFFSGSETEVTLNFHQLTRPFLKVIEIQ